MDINIRAKDFKLTPEIEDYAQKKIVHLTKFDDKIMETIVRLFSGKEHTSDTKFRAEVTMHLPNKIIVADAKAKEIFAAIDIVSEKLERQIEKYKEKLIEKR